MELIAGALFFIAATLWAALLGNDGDWIVLFIFCFSGFLIVKGLFK